MQPLFVGGTLSPVRRTLPLFAVPLRLALAVGLYFDPLPLLREPLPYPLALRVAPLTVVGTPHRLAIVRVPPLTRVLLLLGKPKRAAMPQRPLPR